MAKPANKPKRRLIACAPCGWERVVPDGVDVEVAQAGHSFDATGDGLAHACATSEDAGENVHLIEESILRTGAAWLAGARAVSLRDVVRVETVVRAEAAEAVLAAETVRGNALGAQLATATADVANLTARLDEAARLVASVRVANDELTAAEKA